MSTQPPSPSREALLDQVRRRAAARRQSRQRRFALGGVLAAAAALAIALPLTVFAGTGTTTVNVVSPPTRPAPTVPARTGPPATGPAVTPTSTAPATTASGPVTTVSSAAGTRPVTGCLATQLTATPGMSNAGMGHIGDSITFTNVSSATCTLYGYPGLLMLDRSGQALPTDVIRGTATATAGPSAPVAEPLVTLRPGGAAYFNLGWEDATGYGTASCPTSWRVEITPPNAFHSIKIAWAINPYGGATIQQLHCGEIVVSPVYAGRAPAGL